MTQLTLWAIRHKPTGHYLPQPHGRLGRGGSHVEPVAYDGTRKTMPRLSYTEAAAKNILAAWLHGKYVAYRSGSSSPEDYYEDIDIIPQDHRIKGDMEVVPFTMEIP